MLTNGLYRPSPHLTCTCTATSVPPQVLTNGLYRPTLHRVVNTAGRSRVSVPFFYETNFDAQVAPLPQFCMPGRCAWQGGAGQGGVARAPS